MSRLDRLLNQVLGPRPHPHADRSSPPAGTRPATESVPLMDLQPRKTTASYTADKPWLASLHGTDALRSITLDVARFTPVDGVIASGTPLGRVTETKLVVPWTPDAKDGSNQLTGFLYSEIVASGATRAGASLLWHGVIATAHVPGGFDPAKVTASSTLTYYV